MSLSLTTKGLENKAAWKESGYALPQYDRQIVSSNTKKNPFWIHFGPGNIFRAFQANIVQNLLNAGLLDRGLIVAEGYDYEIVEKMNRPHDDYHLLVTLKADGNIEKTVIGSVVESLTVNSQNETDWSRLKEIFEKDSLQMVSFTITEKGYSLVNGRGEYLPGVPEDFANGPEHAMSYMGKVAALIYVRYLAGQKPVAMVSMDNCSHNGDKLYTAVNTFAEKWVENGVVDAGFKEYVNDKRKVSFPWSMIDKITPRPDASVEAILKADGVEDLEPVVTSKNTWVAPFVNAEETEYLVIENTFPNGIPEVLKNGGVIFTERETVDKVEKMKVCTCLNPLHTALAVFGCVLGYKKISEEMKDAELKKMVEIIGYVEGLPVVVNPGVLEPKNFLDTVLNVRIPNPFMPDTPQRIVTDTSQKLAIRFGETIKAYAASETLKVADLKWIPMVFAGWLRYLMAIDDAGNKFELSPDPLLDEVCPVVSAVQLGDNIDVEATLRPILINKKIFGIDLYEVGLADIVCKYFGEMIAGVGAVRTTLKKYASHGIEKEVKKNVAETIGKMGVIPVVVLKDVKDAVPLANALIEGGLPCAEVTFRTPAAEESIRTIAENFPKMFVGAGTVLTIDQVDRAVEAGAKFIVTPGFDVEIVDYCLSKKIPVFPGCITPSDLALAVKRGLTVVKFFPAEQFGGVATIKALSAPYPNVKFMPTGGIHTKNLEKYLSFDRIIACGGSWMVKGDLIKEGKFDKIKELAAEAVKLVADIKSK